MSFPYAFRRAFQSLFRERWINLLSILTIASCLLIISLAYLFVYNLDLATEKLPEKFSMVLYLEDNLPREKIDQVINSLRKNQAIYSIRFISKEEALRELKTTLKNSHYVLEGLEGNPLPDSIELKLRKDDVGPETAKKIAGEVNKIKGVDEVEYGEGFLSTIHQLKLGVKTVGMILIVILSTGIIFVCYSTVKILFYRRNEEIETFKLLGATRAFIKAPFLIEGGAIGAFGGMLSLLSIFSFYYILLFRLSISIPILKTILFPINLFLALPFVGMFLGVAGAFIALGRLRY